MVERRCMDPFGLRYMDDSHCVSGIQADPPKQST